MLNFKVSVITVCFNEFSGIRQTCESIIFQTFKDYEWIVIDGGSTDGTLDILAEYKDQISVLVSGPDSGVYNAMNKGIKLASGEYIIFMNGGDYFASDDVLADCMSNATEDILYGNILAENSNGDFSEVKYPDVLPAKFFINKMISHQTLFYKRNLFLEFGLLDESLKLVADLDSLIRFLCINRCSYRHIPKCVAVFSYGGISTSPKFRYKRQLENHLVRKKYFPAYKLTFNFWKMELRLRFSKRYSA